MAPSSLRLTSIQKESVTLAWEPPQWDGGSPITGYIVERLDPKFGNWQTVGETDGRTHNCHVSQSLLTLVMVSGVIFDPAA